MTRRQSRFAGVVCALLLAAALALWAALPGRAPAPTSEGPRLAAHRIAAFEDAPAPARAAAFSGDGRWLATANAAGPVVLRRIPDLAVARRLENRGGATTVAFAPDASWLA